MMLESVICLNFVSFIKHYYVHSNTKINSNPILMNPLPVKTHVVASLIELWGFGDVDHMVPLTLVQIWLYSFFVCLPPLFLSLFLLSSAT